MRISATLTLLLAAAAPLAAHETITTKLTWTRDIQRIFIHRCMNCHQEGGPAPFALTTWKQARPWAVAIREQVNARLMPPANTVKGFGAFRHDPALTQEEIQLITDWANGGAPEGDPRLESDELPRLWTRAPAPPGTPLAVRESLRLPSGLQLTGLSLDGLPPGASLHAVLEHPDGSLEPLAWVRHFQPAWTHPLHFAEPIPAPAGSLVRLIAAPGATITVFTLPSR
jgi:hypothetical protein